MTVFERRSPLTNFNEPNRFCGSCNIYLCLDKPETSPEQIAQLLKHCKECTAWCKNGVQLLNKDNVGQCWHCTFQLDEQEIFNIKSKETLLVPFCARRNLMIIGNQEHVVCPYFRDRGGFSDGVT